MFQYLGEETAEIEYKEFRFSTLTICSFSKKLKDFVVDGISDEFISVLQNEVEEMFTKYIAKYAVSFGNSEYDGCTLMYGVTDFGEKIGVPLKLDVDADRLKALTKSILSSVSVELSEKVDVSFEELTVQESSLGMSSRDCFLLQERVHDSWRESERVFAESQREFFADLKRYKESINDIINFHHIRLELVDYVIATGIHCPNIIKRLRNTSVPIKFRDGEVSKKKRKLYSMSYWIVQFRDDRMNEILRRKPCKFSREREPMDPGFVVLRSFRPLIRDILSLGYKFYLIKFTMPSRMFNLKLDGVGYVRSTRPDSGDPYCKRI